MGMELQEEANCEARRGGNKCGRKAVFVIEPTDRETAFFACTDDVGNIMVQNDIDSAYVEQL